MKMRTAVKVCVHACVRASLCDLPGRGGVAPCSRKEGKAMRAPPAHSPPLPPNPEGDNKWEERVNP